MKANRVSFMKMALKQAQNRFYYLCGMNKIAIFASGSGSNAENLVRYFDKEWSAYLVY